MVRPLTSFAGFTYLAVLLMVVILGIMQGVAYQYMSTVMQREREEELLFRGQQIVEGIARWNNVYNLPNQPKHGPLNDLKDLLKDPNSLATIRYLRRNPAKEYNDPITGKEWEVVRDPSGQKGIIGVRSTSEKTPLKGGSFGEVLAHNLNPNDRLDACLMTMFRAFGSPPPVPGLTTRPIPGLTTPGMTTPPGGTPLMKKYSDWWFVYIIPETVTGATIPGQPPGQ